MCVKNHYFLRFEAFLPLGRIWINRHKVLSVWLSKDDFITKQLMKHENNYFTRIFLIFFVGKKKGHIFAPSKMTLSMIVPLCNGSTAGFGSVSPGSNPGGSTRLCRKRLTFNELSVCFFNGYNIGKTLLFCVFLKIFICISTEYVYKYIELVS